MDKLFVDDNALALYYASLEGRVDALEEGGGGGSSLPDVTASDNGKVLTVSSGKWAAKAAPTELPSVTSSDNGKVLGVSGGKWAKQAAPTELPAVSASDNGKVLAVSNGAWAKQTAPAELPAVTATDNGNVLTVVEGQWQKAEPSGGGSVTPLIFETTGEYPYTHSTVTVEETWEAYKAGRPVIYKYYYESPAGDAEGSIEEDYSIVTYIRKQISGEYTYWSMQTNGASFVGGNDGYWVFPD